MNGSSERLPRTDNDRHALSARLNYAFGIALLLVVVLLWTVSNFITQNLYKIGYGKPFLVTYLNTTSFAIYLLPSIIRRIWSQCAALPLDVNNYSYRRIVAETPLEEIEQIDSQAEPDSLDRFTTKQTAQLAVIFVVVWFLANWSVNASLEYTTVASATILASTSGFFTLLVGRIFEVEALDIFKIGAVLVSFSGVVLVANSDSSTSSEATPATVSPPMILSSPIYGDALALCSAICYAIYVILLKVRIGSESRIDMQLFFGFVGLYNIIAFWPILLILHFTGAELLEWPQSRQVWLTILVNMLITFASDFIYVLAMLKTTPLVVTVGLSLTIPFAVVGDFMLAIPTKSQALIGALLVLTSFIAIGLPRRRDLELMEGVAPAAVNTQAGVEVE